MKQESTIDAVLRLAKQIQPDLWKRTRAVAKIIDPAAFSTDWIVTPESARRLHRTRQRYMQAAAMVKAQEILRVLGVNTDADWYEIISRLAREKE